MHRTFWCILPFIFIAEQACCQTFAEGYYITLNNDTVTAQIKIPRDLFGSIRIETLEKKVKITDTVSLALKKLTQEDIRGYGFAYNGTERDFVSKALKTNQYRFFEKLANGPRASCYYYYTTGYRGRIYQTFIVEANNQSVSIQAWRSRKKIKNQMKQLFAEQPEVQNLIAQTRVTKSRLKLYLSRLFTQINQL